MRIGHSEEIEFRSRFACMPQPTARHHVPVEIETASGDIAALAYLTEEISVIAADWLRLFRTVREIDALDRPGEAGAEAATSEIPWTFESHRRDCPKCGLRIMKAAAICGYCWTRLQPVGESPEELRTDVGPVVREAGDRAPAGPRRKCRVCGGMIALDATLCGYCWAKVAA